MVKACIKKLCDEQTALSAEEATAAMTSLMSGQCTQAQCGAWLVAMRNVAYTPEVVAACAEVMTSVAAPIDLADFKAANKTVDIVGTGGDVCAAATAPACGWWWWGWWWWWWW